MRMAGISLMLVLLVCGCSPTPPPSQNSSAANSQGDAGTAKPAANNEADAGELADRSLTPEEYVKLGLPKIDRPWSSSDMARAYKVLSEIAKREPQELPRYGSPKSGKVFARITSEDNLDSVRKKSLPLSIRTGFTLQYLHAITSIGKLYGTAAFQQKTGNEEATEIFGVTMQVAGILKELSEEVVVALDKKDPTYSARLKGAKQMTAGLEPILQGLLTHLTANKKMSPETKSRLIEHLNKSLPEIVKVLPLSAQKALQSNLETLSQRPEFAEHREDFAPLLEKISSIIEEPPANESDRK